MVKQRGFALLVVLLVVALVALVSTAGVVRGAQEERRDAEEELIATGLTWQGALRSYADSSPGQAALGPMSLQDLLRDPRFPGLKRHLRRIPADPMTGRPEWGQVKSPDGHIVGVHSLAEGVPIKRSGFEPPLDALNDAGSYREWVFGVSRPVPASPTRNGAR